MQPGDGVVGAAGSVAGRPVYCYAQDQTFVGGSLGEAHADTIVRVMELAERAEAPGGRFRRLRRRAHGRRHRGAGRLRAHLPPQRAALRPRAADLRDQRRVGRRRLLLAGAHRLRGDDRGVGDVPDGSRHRPRGDGRGRGRRRPGRAGRALAQRRLRSSWRPTTSTRSAPCATCSRSSRSTPARRRRSDRPQRCVPSTRMRPCPRAGGKVYDIRGVIGALVDGGELLEVSGAGRATW